MAQFKISKIRHLKWSKILESVKYKMVYIAKSKNLMPDFLSRSNPFDAKKSKTLGKKREAYLLNAGLHQTKKEFEKSRNCKEERNKQHVFLLNGIKKN
jgi:hypothetical protein